MIDMMTVPQAAEFLGVHPVTVYQAIREGRLRSIEVLGKKGVLKADVLDYQHRTQSVGPQGGRPKKKKVGVPDIG